MSQSRYLTPSQIASRLRVGVDKIHAWIKSGQLRASNLATKTTGRPRYGIDERDLDAFIAGRTVTPRTRISRTSRKRLKNDVVEFF
jgi:excisionase family DNA binding protein